MLIPVLTAGVDEPDEVAYLWPCNVKTWTHWQQVQTQWRTSGMGSPTGIDYAGVRAYLDGVGMKSKQRKNTFDGIRAAEHATLIAWGEKAKAKSEKEKRG